jgi:3-deoxy-7-phosphoheptulonate synthase
MVDMSHANSSKDHNRQLVVAEDLARQITEGDRDIVGVMVESNLVAGRQDISTDKASLTYGQSITDACISWEDTETVLAQLAHAVNARRGK